MPPFTNLSPNARDPDQTKKTLKFSRLHSIREVQYIIQYHKNSDEGRIWKEEKQPREFRGNRFTSAQLFRFFRSEYTLCTCSCTAGKPASTIQYGYRKCGTHARVFSPSTRACEQQEWNKRKQQMKVRREA